MEEKQPKLDAPIPGMSLTHELGARPWQQPPQYPTVEEAVDHYTSRMMTDEFADQLVDIMDMGIPLTTLANTIQLAGVMEGKHTTDVGLLVLPVLIETMMVIGDSAGIEYDTGLEDEPRTSRDSLAKRSVEKLRNERDKKALDPEDGMADTLVEEAKMESASEEVEDSPQEEPMGLMARRN